MRLFLTADTGYTDSNVALRPVEMSYDVTAAGDVISDAREAVLEHPCGCA